MPKLLTREAILGVKDLVREDVDVPEWGGPVRVQGLTAAERDDFEASLLKDGKLSTTNIRAKLVVRCCRDDEGNRLFCDEDADELALKSGRAVDRVFAVAQRLSGLSRSDVEELRGNSSAGQRAGSSSPSPTAGE